MNEPSFGLPEFFISRSHIFNGVELNFGSWLSPGRYVRAEPVVMTAHDADPSGIQKEHPPMLSLSHSIAEPVLQSMMDQLWEHGIRPRDIGTAGHLAATKVHLEDMRSIAFAKLEISKP